MALRLYAWTFLATGPPAEVEEALQRHLEQRRELRDAGKLRLAGEFPDGEGLLEIFEVQDRLEAERLARSSPLVADGLGSWMLREWRELDLGA